MNMGCQRFSTATAKQNKTKEQLNRARGALVGLACGDALGTTLEFRQRVNGSVLHTEMTGGGAFNVKPGEWTDDTAMALCMAASLTEQKGFDPVDQLKRYVHWRQEGYQACQGRCIDIGGATSAALNRFTKNNMAFAGSTEARSSGNGGIMRLAPTVLAAADYTSTIALAIDSSRTTHASPDSLDAAELLGHILWQLLQGEKLHALLENLPQFISRDANIRRIQKGDFRYMDRAAVNSSGYTIHTLEAALWSCYHSNSFEEALIKAVNLGGDADTVGAVTGQIAGAAYGASAIPQRWLAKLAWKDKLQAYADSLIELELAYRAS